MIHSLGSLSEGFKFEVIGPVHSFTSISVESVDAREQPLFPVLFTVPDLLETRLRVSDFEDRETQLVATRSVHASK